MMMIRNHFTAWVFCHVSNSCFCHFENWGDLQPGEKRNRFMFVFFSSGDHPKSRSFSETWQIFGSLNYGMKGVET